MNLDQENNMKKRTKLDKVLDFIAYTVVGSVFGGLLILFGRIIYITAPESLYLIATVVGSLRFLWAVGRITGCSMCSSSEDYY